MKRMYEHTESLLVRRENNGKKVECEVVNVA